MCVHKDVSTLTGVAQNTACKSKTDARACAHHNEVDRFVQSNSDFGKTDPVDIEDLVTSGNGEKSAAGAARVRITSPATWRAARTSYSCRTITSSTRNCARRRTSRGRARCFSSTRRITSRACARTRRRSTCPPRTSRGRFARRRRRSSSRRRRRRVWRGERRRKNCGSTRGGRDEDDGFGGGGERLGVNGNTPAAGGDADAKPKRRAVEYKQLRGILLALENKIAETLAGGGGGGPNGKGGDELVRPCEAFFDMLAELRVVEGEGSKNTVRMLVEVMTDAVALLAGEAAVAGRKSRSRASSFRLSEVSDALEKAFRMRREGHLASFRLRIGPDESRGGDRSGA